MADWFWLNLLVTGGGLGVAIWAIISAKNGVIRTIKNDRDLVLQSITNGRDIAKKQQTLETILNAELTRLHEEAFNIFKEYNSDTGVTIAELGVEKSKLNEEQRGRSDSIYAILNWYEYMAVGIRHDIVSEEILRNASFTTVKNVWEDSKPFVEAVRLRIKTKTAYETLEWLTCRWCDAGYDGKLPPL